MKVLLALTTLAIVYRLFAIIIADIPLVFNYPLVSGDCGRICGNRGLCQTLCEMRMAIGLDMDPYLDIDPLSKEGNPYVRLLAATAILLITPLLMNMRSKLHKGECTKTVGLIGFCVWGYAMLGFVVLVTAVSPSPGMAVLYNSLDIFLIPGIFYAATL